MNIYKTNLLSLASYLYTKEQIKFVGLDKSDPTQVFFKFEPTEEADRLSEEYFTGGAKANPLELFKNYKVLKDMVFEVRRSLRRQYEFPQESMPAPYEDIR